MCLLDYHVVHLQYSRMYIYISLFMYMLHVYIFFFKNKAWRLHCICVCLYVCVSRCLSLYLCIYIERERVFFSLFQFFFPSSLTLKHTHFRTQEENSCLHIAAAKGSNAILRILLNAGAKVSAKNRVDR